MGAQSARRPASKIFESKRNIRLELKHPFLEPLREQDGFTYFKERMSGTTTVTLKRLGR